MIQNISIEEIAQNMRTYEETYEQSVPMGEWIIVRLDGRNFSSLTEAHYNKPFDAKFHSAMQGAAKHILEEFYGAYAYVASDEISLLFAPDWHMFDRRLQKLTTLLASSTSVSFSRRISFTEHATSFDARALSFSTLEEVCTYFHWRLSEVERCALQTIAYWTLRKAGMRAWEATKSLNGLSVSQKQDILREYGIEYVAVPFWQRYGTGLYWEIYEKEGYNPISQKTVVTTRKRIASFDNFASRRGYHDWLFSTFAQLERESNGLWPESNTSPK